MAKETRVEVDWLTRAGARLLDGSKKRSFVLSTLVVSAAPIGGQSRIARTIAHDKPVRSLPFGAYLGAAQKIPFANAARLMFQNNISGLPVIDAKGSLVGIVQDRCVRSHRDHMPSRFSLAYLQGLADAEAGRNAIFAAQLARGGLTGPAPIFEGHSGFFQQVSGPASVDPGTFGGQDMPFRIHQCSLKRYPAVIYTQTAIVACIEVAKAVGSLDRIAAIEIATTRRGYERTGSEPEKWSPETRDTADHSLPYITARAMFDGDITNESFAPHMFRDPRVLAFMQKITVREDPVLSARVGAAVPTRVTAILVDGQRISREVDHAPGFAQRPMNRSEVELKFRGNVGNSWPKERTDSNLEALWALERTDDLATLLGMLSVKTSP
jgi:MmgE/PrpD C-terminal domain/MmgE/PrpD N-terminal domain